MFNKLTPDEVDRYSRHIIMPQIGSEGQRKLIDSSVLIIGAGGLGSPAALYLVLSSLSFLGILFQNCSDSTKYIIGDMMVDAPCHNAWFVRGHNVF